MVRRKNASINIVKLCGIPWRKIAFLRASSKRGTLKRAYTDLSLVTARNSVTERGNLNKLRFNSPGISESDEIQSVLLIRNETLPSVHLQ